MLALAGLAIGWLASICGIGGGLFAVPLLHYGFRFDLKRSVATSLVMVFATTSASTLTEALRADSAIRWPLALAMVAGSLGGAQLGYLTAKRLPGAAMKVVFAVVLTVAGVRMLALDPGSPAQSGGIDGAWTYPYAVLAGALAGYVAPLLGIGGGLVSVPALFLGIPGMGYLGARACSLAVGAVASSRSVWLYSRDGQVDLRRGAWLGAGALVGSALGVATVHLPGVVRYAQWAMGTILCVVAVRFGVDVWRVRLTARKSPGTRS